MNEEPSPGQKASGILSATSRVRGIAGAIARPGCEARGPEERRARAPWGDFLGQFAWAHFVTLTTEAPTSADALRREFDRFHREVARWARGPVPWFYAIELGALGDRPHVHALLAGTGHLSTEVIARRWRLGHTRVRVYDPTRGAAWYVSKDLLRNPDAWDVSRRPPPRRDNIARG